MQTARNSRIEFSHVTISQFNAPLASTPGGPNNIELNGEAAEFGGESAEGVTPEEMIKVLNEINQMDNFQGDAKNTIVPKLEDLLLKLKDQEIKSKVSTVDTEIGSGLRVSILKFTAQVRFMWCRRL